MGLARLTAYAAGFVAEIPFLVTIRRQLLLHRAVPGHLTNRVDYAWLVSLIAPGWSTCCCAGR
jgi:hypothetical protein